MTNWEMAWVDIETTGLDAIVDVPLEFGIMLTDKDGNIGPWFSWLIWETNKHYANATDRATQDEIVGPMHTKSGLWEELVKRIDVFTRDQADSMIVSWLDDNGAGKLPLCGSSIGSLDRPFILRHFPKLNERLHYRNIDNSSIKELCKMHNPRVYQKISEYTTKRETHRVMEDIEDSISEYRYYLDNFLWVAE